MNIDDEITVKITQLRDGAIKVRAIHENTQRIFGEWFVHEQMPRIQLVVTTDGLKITVG